MRLLRSAALWLALDLAALALGAWGLGRLARHPKNRVAQVSLAEAYAALGEADKARRAIESRDARGAR